MLASRSFAAFQAFHLLLLVGCSRSTSTPPGEYYDLPPFLGNGPRTVSHEFTVRNTTERPVTLLKEHHSCSCQTIELALTTLDPGQSTPLRMKFYTTGSKPIRELLRCTVTTDHPDFPEWIYAVRCKGYPRLYASQQQIDFGPLSSKQLDSAKRTVPLEGFIRDGEPLPSLVVDCAPPLAASISPMTVEEPNAGFRKWSCALTISVTPRALMTSGSQSVNVQIPKAETPESVDVSALWQSEHAVIASPETIVFGLSVPRTSSIVTKTITLTSRDGSPFSLSYLPADSSRHYLQAESSRSATNSDREHTFTIQLIPNKCDPSKRYLNGTLEFRTTHPRQPTLTVPWTAVIQAASPPSKDAPGTS